MYSYYYRPEQGGQKHYNPTFEKMKQQQSNCLCRTQVNIFLCQQAFVCFTTNKCQDEVLTDMGISVLPTWASR